MKIVTKEELEDILKKHKKWLTNEGGKRAYLSNLDLSNLNLTNVDLRCAILIDVNLRYADLTGADLRHSDLSYVDLSCANLNNSNLEFANLRFANLKLTRMCGANLRGADFEGANLMYTIFDPNEQIRFGLILKEDLVGYKKGVDNKIVELIIPKDSIVFSINNSKCRTNKAKVVSITNIDNTCNYDKVASNYDGNFIYEVGKEIEVENFNLMYNVECAEGIHFFRSRKEAVEYCI